MSDKPGCSCGRICACSLGTALGVVWALGVAIVGLLAWRVGYGHAVVTTLGSVYIGFGPTLAGVGLGVLWGFVDGFITGFLIGVIYNFVLKGCHKSCGKCNGGEGK